MNYEVFSESDFTLLFLLSFVTSDNELHDRLKKLGLCFKR